MDIKYIKSVMKEFENSNVHKMVVKFDDKSISLEKETKQVVQKIEQVQTAQPQQQLPSTPATKMPVEEHLESINAPLVGTFYEAPSPKDRAFVKVGDYVKTGQTVCIIEAMKVMNEIKAPSAGIIKEILVKNEDMVEFDQPLMVIE